MDDLLRTHREEILAIAARHGAYNVRVFGSFARGEGRPDSDVDFLVDASKNASFFFPAGLVVDLEELLGRNVDVVTKDALHWYIRDDVMREAIPL